MVNTTNRQLRKTRERLTAAYRKGLEDAAEVVREKCGPCEGTGFGGEDERGPYGCEYCGRPRDAIRALKEREEAPSE